jgi:hypothetical protein
LIGLPDDFAHSHCCQNSSNHPITIPAALIIIPSAVRDGSCRGGTRELSLGEVELVFHSGGHALNFESLSSALSIR